MKKYKSKGTRSPESAEAIIKYNIYVIYHMPKRYKNVHSTLETDKEQQPLRDLLLKILNFSRKSKTVIWDQRYINHLDNGRITYDFRQNQSTGTASRYFNFLCAMGFLKKQKQVAGHMTRINEEFLKETGKPRPINVVSIPKYTQAYLMQIETMTQLLTDHQVTKGNISRNRLLAAGLLDLADEVYPINSKKSFPGKQKLYSRLEQVIEQALNEHGYIYMAQVAAALEMPEEAVKALKKIFNEDFSSKYHYGATTAEQAEKYDIPTKKWIITRREDNGSKEKAKKILQ